VNGVLVVDKPVGVTSHGIVMRVKRLLGAVKVGHLGTLDPAATGVLPLVINRGTKFAPWLEKGQKEYAAEMTLGVETDSYDSEGAVLTKSDASGISAGDIERVFAGFRGGIKQVPPMFSSVKRSGRPLYKLARQGITVERPARDVEIFSLEVTGVSNPVVSFEVTCSRGTYIRSICHDSGRVLGCGAHMSGLRRLRSGVFHITEAVDLESGLDRAALQAAIIPLDEALLRAAEVFKAVPLGGGVVIDGAGHVEDVVVEDCSDIDLSIGTRLRLPLERGFSPFHEEGEMIRLTFEGLNVALAKHVREDLYKVKWGFSRSSYNETCKAL